MDDVIGNILLLVTIIVSLSIVGMMLLFAVLWIMDWRQERKFKKYQKEGLSKKDWKMEKEKHINISQGIDVEPTVLHQIPLGVFAVVKDENGEERKVDLRDIVGSKGKNKEENK